MAAKSKRGRNEIPVGRWFLGEILGLVRQFGHHIIWAAVSCFAIDEAARTLQAFAGRTSVADLALRIAAHLNTTVTASLTISGITIVLWANEFRRHRATRERLTQRTVELELRLDRDRESSLLTSQGRTRQGDQ